MKPRGGLMGKGWSPLHEGLTHTLPPTLNVTEQRQTRREMKQCVLISSHDLKASPPAGILILHLSSLSGGVTEVEKLFILKELLSP